MNICGDIVDEILSRLPVKSLLRFKLVCKDWYFHIQTDCFIAKHVKNQTTTNEKTLIYHRDIAVSICSEQETKDDDDEEDADRRTLFHQDHQYHKEDMPLHHLEKYLRGARLIGTCNGVVCLDYTVWNPNQSAFDRIITLWNPATRDFKTLSSWKLQRPPPVIHLNTRIGHLASDHIGFGFDSTFNDYKVIQIVPCYEKQRIKQAMIYSLNTNFWGEIDYSNVSAEISAVGDYGNTITLRENAYWLNLSFDMLQKPVLLSFGMEKEIFQLTPLPSECMPLSDNFLNLCDKEFFTLLESIAVAIHIKRGTTRILEIWTTKELEHGRVSWIKLLNIGHSSEIGRSLGFRECKNCDDFLFMFTHDYNLERNVMKGIYINNRGEIKHDKLMTIRLENKIGVPVKVLTYVENLVSVNRP